MAEWKFGKGRGKVNTGRCDNELSADVLGGGRGPADEGELAGMEGMKGEEKRTGDEGEEGVDEDRSHQALSQRDGRASLSPEKKKLQKEGTQ